MLSKQELLKIKIMTSGIDISEVAKNKLSSGGKNPLSIFEYPTTGGIILKIRGTDIYVNAPFDSKIVDDPKVILDHIDGEFFLKNKNDVFAVEIIPLSDGILEKNKKGVLFSDLAMVHLDRLRISPIDGCAFSCKFCDMSKWEYKKQDIDDLVEAGKKAIKESKMPINHILISGGTPKKGDWSYQDEVIKRVCLEFKLPVDVMMTPVEDFSYLLKLKSYGVRELSVNLEIFDEKTAKKLIPQKAALGRKLYFDFFKQAVEIFGKGNVRSILIVGLEPLESTLSGVEEMIKIGVSPVLSSYMPSSNAELQNQEKVSEEMLIEVWNRSLEIVKKYDNGVGLGPRCKPCQHNTLTFPGSYPDFYY